MIGLYILVLVSLLFFILQEIFNCSDKSSRSLSISANWVKKYVIQENKDGTFSAKQQNRFCFIPIKQYKNIAYFIGDNYYNTFAEAKDALDRHFFSPTAIAKAHPYKQSDPKPEKH